MRANLFTEDAPFQTVEEYTEWWLEKKGEFNLTKKGMAIDAQFEELINGEFSEVPLSQAHHLTVNQIDDLIETLDESYPWTEEDEEIHEFTEQDFLDFENKFLGVAI